MNNNTTIRNLILAFLFLSPGCAGPAVLPPMGDSGPVLPLDGAVCPSGLMPGDFAVVAFATPWTDAAALCEACGMGLPSIHSQGDNDRLLAFLVANGVYASWIGYRVSDGPVWLTDGSPVTFTAWAPGNPSGGTEDCVEMIDYDPGTPANHGLWNDLPCTSPLPVVCEAL